MNELLERAVPPHTGHGDWNAIVRDARGARRRWAALRFAVVAIAAAAVLIAWPSPSTLDRALAATGDGRVLHLVFASEQPRVEVDLETGRTLAMVSGRHEVWFDPRGETFERETFAGVVQWAAANPSDHGREIYASLLAGYRDALRDGKVAGENAKTVWITIAPGHDVGVSRRTYRPVAMRVGGHETRILTYETIDAVPRVEPVGMDGMQQPPAEREYEDGLIVEGEHAGTLVGLRGVVPKPGTMLLAGPTGLTQIGGRLVAIHSPSAERTLAIARELRARG